MEQDELTPIWKALADPTRRTILDLLKAAPRTTGELADAFPALSRFAVMKHLTVLETANLVLVRRHGRERWNHLNAVPIKAIADRWIGKYEDQWAGSLLRLKLFTESTLPRKEIAVNEVVNSGPIEIRSILIEQEVAIAVSPQGLFRSLTDGIGKWWDKPFGAGDISLEAKVGGFFQEKWSETDGAIYAVVTRVKKDEQLILTGTMGMTGPVVGVMEFNLVAIPEGTLLKLTHQAIGNVNDGTVSDYSQGWEHLLNNCLKPYAETGKSIR